MFNWLRRIKRRRVADRPFPAEWHDILARHARFLTSLRGEQQAKVRRSIQILVAEKNWEGCGGLKITDEHRVTIAAQIARMTVHFEAEFFDSVLSILIYPSAYMARSQTQLSGGIVVEGNSGRLGEAWHRGPVILSWNEVLDNVRNPYPQRNVVIHEFAHQLDMQNGSYADGIPTVESLECAQRWSRVMPAAFDDLAHKCELGIPTVLDCYGATNPAEFFAVASESYFERPAELEDDWPAVFELLDDFYCNRTR